MNKLVWRIIVSSGRRVPTREYHVEPGVFYVTHSHHSVSGPFSLDDRRFAKAHDCLAL